ncbi:hypothetical protein EDB81DRAFT_808431 [Dactylonectria macrodidyma]|uniref:Ester cyclase n=1 Tax=Dactylonectria macrodidyma TaxID=307937 RepID=A0A9P9DYL8_9HYPO|nr:hypothetical protein EDB81DRAFT_808431 [Dactylonectria macrodidyma]
MSVKQTLDRFVEFVNSADPAIGNEVIHESAKFHVPFDSKTLIGVDGYLELLGMMRRAFPDVQWTLEDTICEGDKVVGRFKTRGTHNGPFLGFAPTGKTFEIVGMSLFKFSDGKIIREQALPDMLGTLVQIGAVKIPF